MKIVIMGGSGFIGSALSKALLQRGDTVLVLTRRIKKQNTGNLQFSLWDGASSHTLAAILQNADAVVNLVGENIATKRWDQAQKDRILNSRVQATVSLMEALKVLPPEQRPNTLIQGSAVGYYPASPVYQEESCCFESVVQDPAVSGSFLSHVSARWEEASKEAEELGLRRVIIRTATVFDHTEGALPRLALPFSFFAGGVFGSGKQYFSWIHLADEVGAIMHLLDSQQLSGPFNLAAPEPVTMKTLVETIGQAMKRPAFLKVPSFVIKAILGQMGEELILSGQRATPKRLLEAGYRFKYPTLFLALTEIFERAKAK